MLRARWLVTPKEEETLSFYRACLSTENYISKYLTYDNFSLGSINFKNGDKFRGQFKDGRPCGHGVMKYGRSLPGFTGSEYEEATYDGEWKAGKREG